MSDPTLPLAIDPPRRPIRPLLISGAAYLLLLLIGSILGGEVGQIVLASLNTLPFAILAVLAYLAKDSTNAAWVASGIWLIVLVGGAGLMALLLGVAGAFDLAVDVEAGTPPSLRPGGGLSILISFLGVAASLAAAGLCLLPAVRRRTARILPIDPTSHVHALALACVVGLSLAFITPLIALQRPPLLDLVANAAEQSGGLGGERGSAGLLRDQIYTLAWTIPAAILAVGFGIQRGLREALVRLGLVRPTLRQVLFGIGLAVGLAAAMQAIGAGIDTVWQAFGWPQTDEEAFGELLSFAFSPLGALVIGVTAGLGEELAVRGVLQPRLGIVLSNLFFTSLHALQYNWDALLIVFLVGMVCGLVRRQTNTTTAAIVHGVYNFSLIMLALVAGGEL
jgi:membrane protease YdiL (CAAX protease family)